MKNTNFINECKNRANANRLGKIIVDGIETPITNSNNLQSFEIDSGCYVDGNIIGSVYAKCLKANFIDDQNNLTDKSIQAQIGVKYADLSDEYINMGKYIIERPNNEITANMSQITAYDGLYTNLDKKYVCNIDYSGGNKTVSDLYIDVCSQLGLIPVTTTFINSTIPITANPFTNGESNRTVLQTVAKIACSFVDIDNDTNKIDLCWLSQNQEPDYIFDLNDYSSVEGGKIICGPINCLIIKNSQIDDENVTIKDEESIKLNGEHSITISEDYVLYNAELRKQAINAIWNKVKGMKYVDCKLTTYYGKPFLKLGDKIRIYTSNTEYFDTYVLKHNFTYDGTFASIIESPALTGQEIKTKQDISLGEALRNTQVEVNKQKGEIRSITTKVTKVTNTANDALQKANNGLSNVNVQYYLSTSNTTLSGGTWSDNAPSWVDGKYMWSRTKVTNAKGEVSYEPGINGTCIAGATGATGKDGINGKDGVNGKSITIKSKAIEYQASTSGTSAPTGTWTTTIPNVNKGSYLWTRTTVTYSDDTNTVSYSVAYRGTDGIDGTNGTNGTNGKDGKGITSITYYYATSTSQTAPSEANVTSTTIPTLNATNKYLWQKEVIKFSDNTNKTSILLIAVYGDKGQTGATGKGVKSIVEQYYLSSSNTTQTGGDWSNTQPNWVNGKYIWTRSHITWSDNTTTDTTPILANGLNKANSTANQAQNTANTANGNASTALNTVNNLSIGGRNLLLGTATATGDVSSGSGSLVENLDLFNGITGIKTNLAWQERCMNLKAVAKRGGFNVGDSLVASVYIKSDQDVNVDVSFHRSTGTGNISGSTKTYQNVTINNKWRQFWFPFVADEGSLERVDTRIEINKATGDNYIYWSGWKLEKGNKPTDWTPAPEDIDEDITTAQNTANKANSTATNAISMADSAKKDVQNTNENLMNNYYTISQTNELVQTAESGITNTFSEAGGNNIFRNTGLWFKADTANIQNLYNESFIYCTYNSDAVNKSLTNVYPSSTSVTSYIRSEELMEINSAYEYSLDVPKLTYKHGDTTLSYKTSLLELTSNREFQLENGEILKHELSAGSSTIKFKKNTAYVMLLLENQNFSRNILVGDDLNGKTIYSSLPDNFYETLNKQAVTTSMFVKTSTSNAIGVHTKLSKGLFNVGCNTISNFEQSIMPTINFYVKNDVTTVNEKSLKMSDTFGTVTEIDKNNLAYPYLKIGIATNLEIADAKATLKELSIQIKTSDNLYEFWEGEIVRNSNDEAANNNSMLLLNGEVYQEQEVPNGNYAISFMYQKLNELANASVLINDKEYQLDSTELKQFYTGEQDNETKEYITQPVEVTTNHIRITFKCDVDNAVEIYDLMCNKGTVKLAYSQNENETTTETVNISKGITITSTNMETIFKANANGIRILTLQNATIAYFTDKGLSTKEIIVEDEAQICRTLIQNVGDQTWFTRM